MAITLNRNEAAVLARAVGIECGVGSETDAARLQERLGVEVLVIHSREVSIVAAEGVAHACPTAFTPAPARTIGAGDRFGAGLAAGLVAGLGAVESVMVGNAAAGFFVRRARSANVEELVEFAEEWGGGEC